MFLVPIRPPVWLTQIHRVGAGAAQAERCEKLLAHPEREEALLIRERVLYGQPAGPDPLYHRDDEVDRPRAIGVWIPFSR